MREAIRKDGRDDGARPWFKNEMGGSKCSPGARREKDALLIVVADHLKSGQDPRCEILVAWPRHPVLRLSSIFRLFFSFSRRLHPSF